MSDFTHEPPENTDSIVQRLKLYVEKNYSNSDKKDIQTLINKCSLSIVKTGDWGSRWNYAGAKAILSVNHENYGLVSKSLGRNLVSLIDNLLQNSNYGLEIREVDFVPADVSDIDIEDELSDILTKNKHLAEHLILPNDLIEKGKHMSEVYLYIYFVENSLRLFVESVQNENQFTIPKEVANTISKNKANEQQSKFLPLRGNSDLFYCDFVQLQQIIVANWESFKSHFPQQDQHWLRVKIEDMYRVRNLVAHCGYVAKDEFEMVKSNFKMILKQLKYLK